jgi:hypothetical protein
MHHTQIKSAINKYSEEGYESIPVLMQTIKADYSDITDADVSKIIEGVISSKQAKPGSLNEMVKAIETGVVMKKYDLWKGEFIVLKDRRIPGTGQREVTKVQFRITGGQPKRSGQTMEPAKAEFWNKTHFTAKKQDSDMWFPEGEKFYIIYTLNDDTEQFDMTTEPMNIA